MNSADAPSGSIGWACFTTEDVYVVHVAPAYKDGDIIPPHTVSPQCVCGPRQDITKNGVTMWVHEHVN